MALSKTYDFSSGTTIASAEVNQNFDDLFSAIGTQEFTEQNNISNNESVTSSLDALDIELKDVSDGTTAITLSTSAVITAFKDGSANAITVPTNGMAAAKLMLGDANTIAWFYLNTAPPGWKVQATGADTVLAIAGGAQAYNVNGGNPDSAATWARGDCTLDLTEIPAHSHTGSTAANESSHTHSVDAGSAGGAGTSTLLGGDGAGDITSGSGSAHTHTLTIAEEGGGGAHNHGSTWRPSASVGKLFKLDEA